MEITKFEDMSFEERFRLLFHYLVLKSGKMARTIELPPWPGGHWGLAVLVCSNGDWLRVATREMLRDVIGAARTFGDLDDAPPLMLDGGLGDFEADFYHDALGELMQEVAQAGTPTLRVFSSYQLPEPHWALALVAVQPAGVYDGDAGRVLAALETFVIGIEDAAPAEFSTGLAEFLRLVKTHPRRVGQ